MVAARCPMAYSARVPTSITTVPAWRITASKSAGDRCDTVADVGVAFGGAAVGTPWCRQRNAEAQRRESEGAENDQWRDDGESSRVFTCRSHGASDLNASSACATARQTSSESVNCGGRPSHRSPPSRHRSSPAVSLAVPPAPAAWAGPGWRRRSAIAAAATSINAANAVRRRCGSALADSRVPA